MKSLPSKVRTVAVVWSLASALLPGASLGQGVQQTSELTYQGRIIFDGSPVDGEICSIEFSLWDAEVGGNQAGESPQNVVLPENGYFTTTVDFGPGFAFGPDTFAGSERWIQLHVACASDPNAAQGTTLPRQKVTAAPYATALVPGARTVGAVDGGTAFTANNTTTATFGTGIKAETSATVGTALFAESTSDSLGQSFGVYATAASRGARAVYGESLFSASTMDAVAYGGYFVANAFGDVGVYGESGWSQGDGVGGEFVSAAQNGVGVSAQATGSSGVGVRADGFVDLALAGNGLIVADDSSSSDITIESNDDVFVYLDNDDGEGSSVFEILDGSNRLLPVFQVDQDGDTEVVGDLSVLGNQTVMGSKSAIVEPEGFGQRKVYSVESPGNWFEDFGTGALAGGVAEVEIEAIFAKTVNTSVDYHVFLTPLGDCSLYVAEKRPEGFTVRARSGEVCDAAFDYRVVAKRLGYESARLDPVQH